MCRDDAARDDQNRDTVPNDVNRCVTPVDLYRDAAPIDLHRDAAPIDLYRDAAPIDLYRGDTALTATPQRVLRCERGLGPEPRISLLADEDLTPREERVGSIETSNQRSPRWTGPVPGSPGPRF